MCQDRSQKQGRVQVPGTAYWRLGSHGVSGLAVVLAMGNQDVSIPSGKSEPTEFIGLEGRD